jgi:hypothetical protein
MCADSSLIIDDRISGDLNASNGKSWHAVSDSVMGGISKAELHAAVVAEKSCLRLKGAVSLENYGGFIQASLDLGENGLLDARDYNGIEIEVWGNGQNYNLHLRTTDTRIVWQSYRISFDAPPRWQLLRLPFAAFQPYRTNIPLNLSCLRRVGIVAIGRQMQADIGIGCLSLYR